MEASGMKCRADRNVDDPLDALCIGVALENGVRWTALPNKVMAMLLTLVRWSRVCGVHFFRCSTLQWYDRNFRAKLSYQHIYGFADGGQDKQGKHVLTCLESLC